MSSHTAIAATSKGHFDAIQVPTEAPGENEVLIKVAYGAVIPFDQHIVDKGSYVTKYPWTLGINAAGTIEKIGSGITDLKVGDKVAALGGGESKHRSLQEYCIQPRIAVAKLPDSFALTKAATIPDNFATVFFTFFSQIGLPVPSKLPDTNPPLSETPILIYGAGATTGQYAVQLLHLAGYRNITATASPNHHSYLRSLGATNVFDYRSSTLVGDITKAVGGDGKISLALDCVGAVSGLETVFKVMKTPSKLAVLVPDSPNNLSVPKGVEIVRINAFSMYEKDEYIRDNLMPKIIPALIEGGYLQGNEFALMEEGSLKERVAAALDIHRQNKANGRKILVKIN